MNNAINWFELFTTDIERAQRFYENALEARFKREKEDGRPMAIFLHDGGRENVGGALVADPRKKPSKEGALVYLNANGKLDGVLARVPGAGGKIVVPKTDIGEPGFIAIIEDTEGNVVGLHAEK